MNTEFSQRRMRVVHVTQYLDMGGQEKLLVEFARHADRSRFDLHFVCLSNKGPLANEIEKLGWPVTAFNSPSGFTPGLIPRLALFFRRQSANVVHTHESRPLVYAAPAARLACVKRVIHTRHGRSSDSTPRQIYLTNLAARCVDFYVSVSEDCTRLTLAEGLKWTRLETIRNGIDIERFSFVGPTPGGPAVIVARLNPEKDIATLLQATALVAREDPNYRLKIIGDGPQRGDLEKLKDELGLRNVVAFLGMRDDIPTLMGTASVVVLSSVSEGISLTLLEAMARGLPVVATKVGGTPEIVSHGLTGLLVPPSAPRMMADALLELRRDPLRSRQMGVAGRKRVEEFFDIRRMVARYEEIYTESAKS